MVVCDLDRDVSGEVLGWKLPAWQAVALHKVLPSCGGLIVYLTLICFDFALVYEHFRNHEKAIAAFCIILITLPAIISTIFTLASPPPGLQTDYSAYNTGCDGKDVKWILMQIVNCVLFPIAAIGRYCYQIFWWVEVVFAARDEDKERTKEALRRAKAPSPMEMYLFLQAFLHSAPHIIVNILYMMVRYNNPAYEKVTLQAVSIIVSCMRMSSTATLYGRFEREKLNGKKYPWSSSYAPLIEETQNEKDVKESSDAEEPIYETVGVHNPVLISNQMNSDKNSDLIEFSPRNTLHEVYYDDIHTDSDSGSDCSPSTRNLQTSPTSNSDDEYVTPISIIERVAPRRSTTYTIEEVQITPPPIIPAPRPASLAAWAEKLVENAESIPTWLSAPPRFKYTEEVIQDEPDIPVHVPSMRRRGLEPQDVVAALIHYLGWYLFFISRLLSIAALINFSVIAAVMILFSHYQIMLLLLIVPQASTARRAFYIFLAFIYLFCLMEFKVRFRHVRVWHVFWTITCTIETVVFAGLWVAIDNQIHAWWKGFILKVIFISLFLSYTCFLVYFVILQPKETVVYINKKRNK